MLRVSFVLWTAIALAGLAALSNPSAARAQSPYTWLAGPPSDPNWFMLGVWYQSYSTTRLNRYQSIGLTNYICPTMPTNTDLANLISRGMRLSTNYNSSLLSLSNQGVIDGWNQMDEPDNAQRDSNYTQTVYGPCVPPSVIIDRYNAMKAADPNRPVYLGLGQGVCYDYNSPYPGRGSGSSWAQYPLYCQGGDIICFDVYPYNAVGRIVYQKPWYVAIGVDRLRAWTNYSKPIWVHIETTSIRYDAAPPPKPYQTKAEVWMALVHGAVGIDYFAHSWVDGFHEDGIFSTDPNVVDPGMAGMLATLNAQIKGLAPVLYSPMEANYLDPNGNVNWVVKEFDGDIYLLATAMRERTSLSWTFHLSDLPSSIEAEVLDEGRSVTITDGVFTDDFSNLSVHLYKITVPEPASATALLCGAWLVLRRARKRGARPRHGAAPPG